jgi:uncharacterized protein (DUF362 family)
MTDQAEDRARLDRRHFMKRLAQAGAGIAVAGTGAYLLHDPKGPQPGGETRSAFKLPDYTVPGAGAKMAIARGADRAKTLAAALAAIGGIGQFIKSGDRVMLKVNAAFATPPALSATSSPDLVAEVARLCLAAGAKEVRVTDNPINDPDSCFRLTGIAEAAEGAGAKLLLPRPGYFVNHTVEGASLIREWPLLADPLEGVNKMIGIAPVKDHHRSGASMTMKNWYGLLGGRRNIFHQDINTIITELATMVRPTFVILDGTTTMMSNGPTGGSLSDLKQTDTLIVSTDQVAADAFGVTLLGRTVADLPYIEKAAAAGCGTADYKSLKPAEV